MSLPTMPDHRHVFALEIELLDAHGNLCEGFVATPGDAALLASSFLIAQGSATDCDGADATAGTTRGRGAGNL